ncbi:hypothetical protein ACFQU9_18595 [Actinomadura namibiensis]|uniref:hypothetical protein n=1 Tax=Actinomadura kijaniata TaxID=46161 RepID=UPI003609592A
MFRFAQRMLARLPELSRAAVERCAAEVPFYRNLPRESLDGEVSGAFTASIRLVATTLREDRAPDAAELTEVIDWSARRAADGLPLDAALSAYLAGSLACWERLAADATADELRRYGAHALRYLAAVLPAVALAHLHEQQQLEGQRRDMRHTLISALLAGEPADELAKQSGVSLAPAYLVLLLALEPGPSDPRRTVRRVQAALDAHQQADVLASLTADGGTVLLPAPPACRRACPSCWRASPTRPHARSPPPSRPRRNGRPFPARWRRPERWPTWSAAWTGRPASIAWTTSCSNTSWPAPDGPSPGSPPSWTPWTPAPTC